MSTVLFLVGTILAGLPLIAIFVFCWRLLGFKVALLVIGASFLMAASTIIGIDLLTLSGV